MICHFREREKSYLAYKPNYLTVLIWEVSGKVGSLEKVWKQGS